MKNTNYFQGSNETTSDKAINQEKIRMANVEENQTKNQMQVTLKVQRVN